MAQAEFSSFKQLLKNVYTAHTAKVKELESEIKILKEKLAEKEREINANSTECKRCIELEEAFKSCKKALLDQSKLFENFGQKFSIFNSPRFENQISKTVEISTNDSKEEANFKENFEIDTHFLDTNVLTVPSLEQNSIREIKINAVDKVPVLSNNKSLLKKVIHHDEHLDSFDVCTVTFPQHLKQGSHSTKFDSLVLVPDSLDASLDDQKECEKKSIPVKLNNCSNKTEFKSNENSNLKEGAKLQEDKGSGKRLSSDSLNDDRIKRSNTGKQGQVSKNGDANSKLTNIEDIKNCSTIPPKIIITQESSDEYFQPLDRKSSLDVSVPKKKNVANVTNNKNETEKNSILLNISNKNKLPLNEMPSSLLLVNSNTLPKIIDIDTSNDDDFQEQIPSTKNNPNEDSWDACDKKKSVKKQRNVKSVKTTSKYKMTLDAPPLNYKKPSFKQTKLSKSIFQPKNCTLSKNSPNRTSEVENINPVVIEEEPSPQNPFSTSIPHDTTKSPNVIDIDATFVPEGFHMENRQFMTTNVKKNAVEKSHLKNGSLFSNISFPEELQSISSENLLQNINANTLPKIIDIDASNDDDFQEQIPSTKNNPNEDSWDACDKKKSVKKQRNVKSVKTTSKYKMTLDAPPLNYKKPSFKQTKLSKSIFQPKNCTLSKNSPNRTSEVENINPVVIEEEPSPQNPFSTSIPHDTTKSPNVIDIDATFVPEGFHMENRQFMTTNVKKNAVEKSHLKNGSLFSNISFPEELQSISSENLLQNINENSYHSDSEDAELVKKMDSFDKLPLPEEPAYKYKNEVVRKKSERKQLNAFDCKECEKYYSELGLSDKEKKERMKKCSRHRGKFTPPATPDHFWELEFPDTDECKARGYMDITQKVKLNNIYNI